MILQEFLIVNYNRVKRLRGNIMLVFHIKELLEKNHISRYKMRIYLNWNYKRVNDYYFGRVKDIKSSEIIQMCELFNCNVKDLFEYKKK